MQAGAYVCCRAINGGPAAHQFLLLVPERAETFNGITRKWRDTRYLVLGAYNVSGFLRAASFAASDTGYAELRLIEGAHDYVQVSQVNLLSCLAGGVDAFLEKIHAGFRHYQSLEGSADELRYPSLTEQFDSSRFNSNSWAQSITYWSSRCFGPAEFTQDFRGLDVGNDRRLPARYFGINT